MPLTTGPERTPFWVRLGTLGLTSMKLSNSSGNEVTLTKQSPHLGAIEARYGKASIFVCGNGKYERKRRGNNTSVRLNAVFGFHFILHRRKASACRLDSFPTNPSPTADDCRAGEMIVGYPAQLRARSVT